MIPLKVQLSEDSIENLIVDRIWYPLACSQDSVQTLIQKAMPNRIENLLASKLILTPVVRSLIEIRGTTINSIKIHTYYLNENCQDCL